MGNAVSNHRSRLDPDVVKGLRVRLRSRPRERRWVRTTRRRPDAARAAPRDEAGHVKTPPNPTGCRLQWHNHTGAEGAATSFDPQQPTESGYMSHAYLWGPLKDRPWDAHLEAAEAHGWFMPWNFVPGFCNDANACIP